MIAGFHMNSFATLGFLFIEPTAQADAPIAYLYAKGYTRGTCERRHFDKMMLTQRKTTWQEFEYELDRLQLELDEIRREAHLRFADATAKTYSTTLGTSIQIIKR
jgi:hypothetical protein